MAILQKSDFTLEYRFGKETVVNLKETNSLTITMYDRMVYKGNEKVLLVQYSKVRIKYNGKLIDFTETLKKSFNRSQITPECYRKFLEKIQLGDLAIQENYGIFTIKRVIR